MFGPMLAAMLALVSTIQPTTEAAASERSMWVWGKPDSAAVVQWAVQHQVKELFVSVPTNVTPELPRLTDLKQRADANGIRLAALGGEPGWALDTPTALAWQRAALGTGLFARTHLDVEPYLLAQWNTNQPAVISGFLSMLTTLQQDSSRPLEADVPFWYGTIGTLADDVLTRVDKVTVMSYRDTASGITNVGADMLSRGAAKGKPVRLAAETVALSDCPQCTFAEEGTAALNTALAQVDTAEAGKAAFAGIAIHHYATWKTLGP